MQAAILFVLVVVAIILAVRYGGDAIPQTRRQWAQVIAYWLFTLLVAYEMVTGALWDLLGIGLVRGMLSHLGYPMYLALILGVWKIPCALALLAPRFPRLKEWAYAGAVFDYTGAAASHILAGYGHAGHGGAAWITPFLFAVFTFASWWLRPVERRLTQPAASQSPLRVVSWALPVLISVTLLVFAALTLPKAMPHS